MVWVRINDELIWQDVYIQKTRSEKESEKRYAYIMGQYLLKGKKK